MLAAGRPVRRLADCTPLLQTDGPDRLPFLSILLYLCSTNREIHDPQGREFQPVEPQVISGRLGAKVFAADRSNTWTVAWRIGAALEAADSGQCRG